MAKVRKITNTDTDAGRTLWMFECPGCKFYHSFDDRWEFNGDTDSPTFSPSLLVRSERYETGEKTPTRCHSFVTDGKIRFLNDCTHDLAGTTVDLAEFDL
jgi:hypothetical protein